MVSLLDFVDFGCAQIILMVMHHIGDLLHGHSKNLVTFPWGNVQCWQNKSRHDYTNNQIRNAT